MKTSEQLEKTKVLEEEKIKQLNAECRYHERNAAVFAVAGLLGALKVVTSCSRRLSRLSWNTTENDLKIAFTLASGYLGVQVMFLPYGEANQRAKSVAYCVTKLEARTSKSPEMSSVVGRDSFFDTKEAEGEFTADLNVPKCA